MATPKSISVIAASVPVATPAGSVFYTEGFEVDTGGWVAGALTYLMNRPTGSLARTGTYGLATYRNASVGNLPFATKSLSGFTPGLYYTFTAWGRQPNSADPSAVLGVEGIGHGASVTTTTLGWTQATYVFQATKTTHVLELRSNAVISANVAWDDLAIFEHDPIDLQVTEASITLDDSHAPYGVVTLTAPIPSEEILELIDPRTRQVVLVSAEQEWIEDYKADQTRDFAFRIGDREIDHVNKTVTLTGYTNEFFLFQAGLASATAVEIATVSVRDATQQILALAGQTLEPGTDDHVLPTDHQTLAATNLVTNPSSETATTGYVAVGGTGGTATITNPVVTTPYGTRVSRYTQTASPTTASTTGQYYDVAVTAGLPYSFAINKWDLNFYGGLQFAIEWRTAAATISTVGTVSLGNTAGSVNVNKYTQPDTNSTDSWAFSGTGSIAATTTSPHTGTYAYAVTRSSGTANWSISRTITGLTAGKTYLISDQIRTISGAGTTTVVVGATGFGGATQTLSASYVNRPFSFVATSTSATLTYTFSNVTSGAVVVNVDQTVLTEITPGPNVGVAEIINFVAPATATVARMHYRVSGTSSAAIGMTMDMDGLIAVQGTTLPTYFDGSTTDTAVNDYAWTGTAHASTSTWKKNVASAMTINPGDTYWDFLDTVIQAGALRLFADEQGVWRLVEPAGYLVPGLLNVGETTNAVEGNDIISLVRSSEGVPQWATGVVIKYTWIVAGVTNTAYDVAGTGDVIARIEVERPFPGAGAAAAYLKRYTGRGRVQNLTALLDLEATPSMALSSTMPGTPIQTGVVSAVTFYWSADGDEHGLMDVRSRGLTDTPETAWVLQPVGYAWDDVPVGMSWPEYVTP